MSMTRRVMALLVLAFTARAVASAQSAEPATRDLDPLGRLTDASRYQIELILDSARVAGLPTAPLESKALEGISKRVDSRRIVVAVRMVFRSLRDARSVLGEHASPDELNAAASALRVGLTRAELAHLAQTRREKAITVPLVVLSDLITRGVPRDTASQTILQLWQRGAADDDFLGLWRGVERDIVSGTDPGVALLNRAREVPSRVPSTPEAGSRPEGTETRNP
ncbi:MAG TPA: hypothetical protein VJ867_00885 [Gemmatimonadaceae bacterium]|nr:hypothetical protein [Gemmatimonadaceae bacterium]